MKRTKVAAAVAATVTGSQAVTFHITLKNSKGEDEPAERLIHANVAAIIANGMAQATKLEAFWRENFETIILEFFGVDPFQKSTKADMLSQFRADERLDIMYQVFQQKHSEYPRAQREALKAANNPTTDEGKSAAGAYKEAMRMIRTTANSQAMRVVAYYVEKHAIDAVAGERDQPTARQLIEAVQKDWANRVTLGRGTFKDQDEVNLMNLAIDALRLVLADDTKRKASKSNLFATPDAAADAGDAMHKAAARPILTIGAQRDQSEKKAGPVTIKKGAEAAAML